MKIILALTAIIVGLTIQAFQNAQPIDVTTQKGLKATHQIQK